MGNLPTCKTYKIMIIGVANTAERLSGTWCLTPDMYYLISHHNFLL